MDELKERIRKKNGDHGFQEAINDFIDELDETEDFVIVAKMKNGELVINNTTSQNIKYVGMLEMAKLMLYEMD